MGSQLTQRYFSQKVIVVTGASSGIGAALATQLSRFKTTLAVVGRNRANLERVANAIEERGGRALTFVGDVGDEEFVRHLVEDVAVRFGRIDMLFNNAGMAVVGEVAKLTPQDWSDVLSANLLSVVHGVTACYPIMIRQGFGHIVNTSSLAGLIAMPLIAPYSATKHAIVGLSSSLRYEAARYGIRVSVACPATVRTPMVARTTYRGLDADVFAKLAPDRGMTAERCAEIILRALPRNPEIITPGAAAWLWRLQRMLPSITSAIRHAVVRNYAARTAALHVASGPSTSATIAEQ